MQASQQASGRTGSVLFLSSVAAIEFGGTVNAANEFGVSFNSSMAGLTFGDSINIYVANVNLFLSPKFSRAFFQNGSKDLART